MSQSAANTKRSTARKLSPVAPGAKVTWLELFYDLVFAYAFINVTLAASSDVDELLRTLLLVIVLWYLWVTFVTLENIAPGDEGLMPFATLVGVGGTFIAAVVIPDAYGPQPHLSDILFAGCYTVVRVVQVLGIWQRLRTDPRLRSGWRGLVFPPIVNAGLLLGAALVPRFVPGHSFVIHAVFLGLAVAVAYGAVALYSFRDLERISAHHWADRFAQIILIALGEPIIALASARHLSETLPPTLPIIGTAALSVTIVATMAYAYFDTRMIAGEQALRRTRGRRQIVLARDAYVFLHLPMIIGILVFSLGLRNVLSAIADPNMPVTGVTGIPTAVLLYGGLFVYLMALLAFQLRTRQLVTKVEIAIRPPLLLAIPLVARLPAVLALGLLAVFLLAFSILKRLKGRAARTRLRTAARAAHRAIEAVEAYEHGREDERGPGTPGA